MDALIEIEQGLPYPTVALAQTDAAATTRILRELPPGSAPDTVAKWTIQAGLMLGQAGRPAEALPVTQEAVTMYRELAATSPDRYRPGLARSLSNLGVLFSRLGREAEASAAFAEADRLRRSS